jgi:hypothetical protein
MQYSLPRSTRPVTRFVALSTTTSGMVGSTSVVSTTLSPFRFAGCVTNTFLFWRSHKKDSQAGRSGEQTTPTPQKVPKLENEPISTFFQVLIDDRVLYVTSSHLARTKLCQRHCHSGLTMDKEFGDHVHTSRRHSNRTAISPISEGQWTPISRTMPLSLTLKCSQMKLTSIFQSIKNETRVAPSSDQLNLYICS